jgi:hypothetical protein
MWTKRSDHAAKNGCVDFFNIFLKRTILGIFFTFLLLHSHKEILEEEEEEEEVEEEDTHTHTKKKIIFFSKRVILYHGPATFCNKRTSFASPPAEPTRQ